MGAIKLAFKYKRGCMYNSSAIVFSLPWSKWVGLSKQYLNAKKSTKINLNELKQD